MFFCKSNYLHELKFNADSAGDASVVGVFDFFELGYIIAKVDHLL